MLRHCKPSSLFWMSQLSIVVTLWLFSALAVAQPLPTSAGWHEIANTKLEDVCARTHGFPEIGGNGAGCSGVFAWSGGVFDTKRNRLIVWGGGHNDYYGNEIYAFDLDDQTLQRITDPGLPAGSSSTCQEAIANGTQPNSRHTYDSIAYMENLDRMFVFNGGLACANGGRSHATWMFDFTTKTWQRINATGDIPLAGTSNCCMVSAYNPDTGKVFLHDTTYLYVYDHATSSYQRLTDYIWPSTTYHMTAIIDPRRQRFYIFGGGEQWVYDIGPGSSYTRQQAATTGGSAIINSPYPGLAYDTVRDRIVAWNGGNTVYSLDLDTRVWTATTHANGPGSANSSGTFKRWGYSPAYDAFALVNTSNQNAYIWRLTEGDDTPPPPDDPPSAGMDFAERCATPGVIKCMGFDTDNDITPYVYGSWDGVIRGTLDTTIKASGTGSLRFEIPPYSAGNTSGAWHDSLGGGFGPGKTFYVQFRQRISPEMLTNDFGGTGWKQVIFHAQGRTCASIELTTANDWYRGFPAVNTDCGGRSLAVNLGNGDYLLQQGDYNCHYVNQNPTDCSYFKDSQWMTFYYEVKIGDWSQPNSSVKAWVGYEGESLKQFIDRPNFTLYPNDDPTHVYDYITFLPYMTKKDPARNHPTAYMWFDELIVSTKPIPEPGSSTTPGGADTVAPGKPQNVKASVKQN